MRIDPRRFVSGRGLLVTVVAAGVIAGGGAATAFAAHDDGPGTPTPPSGGAAPGASVTAAEAAAAALKAAPGTIEEMELDDGRRAWEVDLLAGTGGWREVRVDSGTGKILFNRAARPDDDDDDDRNVPTALRKAKVSASEAAQAALKAVPGAVTSVDFEQEDGRSGWEVDVTGRDGAEHELIVDAATAKVVTDKAEQDDDQDDD
ncbi:peptidase M4 [Actinomadura sp. KC216]|uniref:PepSY domain-containing protein n=1 Tax=Actinomadura sp. KC216 TaxID=2530370 RepID=UPI00105026D9|nr:PepSY domain-containing protein [Actinomadura sp. KC216]TDB80696.1 peptidase M4 [Actinomadura sp. KC216]